jgi:tetratricopeptide (TPR) repeat protein
MLSRLLFWVGLSLMIGPTSISADQNPLLNRQQPDPKPIVVIAERDQNRFSEGTLFPASRAAPPDGLYVGMGRSLIGSTADGIRVAQVSHRGPLGPSGISGRRSSSDSEFDRLSQTRVVSPSRASPAGTLFVQAVPKEAEIQFKKAKQLLKREKNDEATRLLHQALDIFPDYFLALQALGTLRVRQGQFETAVKSLSRAIAVNPKSDISFLSMGIAQLNLSRMEECIASLRQSTALNPQSSSAYLILGYALIKDGRALEAENPLQLAFRLGGDRVIESQLYLANAYEKDGKFRDAASALQVYLKHAPKGTDKQKIETMIGKLEAKSAESSK